MNILFSLENPGKREHPRFNSIKNRAEQDAPSYIALMRKESPESLEFQEGRKLIMDLTSAGDIFKNAKKSFSPELNPKEMVLYVDYLEQEVKKLIVN